MSIEKNLTRVLRHDLHMDVKMDLPFDRRGFLPLSILRTMLVFSNLTPRRLQEIVDADHKTRFSIEYREEDLFVRANNGHSTGVYPDIERVYLPWAVHGTFLAAWDCIETEGLKRMGRDYIHLAINTITIQYKQQREMDLYIDCEKMERHGIQVLRCTNGVMYTPGIDGLLCPCFFLEAVNKRTQES